MLREPFQVLWPGMFSFGTSKTDRWASKVCQSSFFGCGIASTAVVVLCCDFLHSCRSARDILSSVEGAQVAQHRCRLGIKWEKQSTRILKLALRFEHLVPLLSAPETLDTLCVHLGREQRISVLLLLRSALVFDCLNFPLE
jgi:hypothetical protein